MKTKEEIMAILPTPAFTLKDTVEVFGVNEICKGFFVYCEYDWDGLNKIIKVGIVSIKNPNFITEIKRDNMTIATTRLVLTEKNYIEKYEIFEREFRKNNPYPIMGG